MRNSNSKTPIADVWKEFSGMFLEEADTETFRRIARVSFYMGASEVMELVTLGDTPSEDEFRRIEAARDECSAFIKALYAAAVKDQVEKQLRSASNES